MRRLHRACQREVQRCGPAGDHDRPVRRVDSHGPAAIGAGTAEECRVRDYGVDDQRPCPVEVGHREKDCAVLSELESGVDVHPAAIDVLIDDRCPVDNVAGARGEHEVPIVGK